MKTLKWVGAILLSGIAAICVYGLSIILLGALLVSYVCCGDYAPAWQLYIHLLVAIMAFIFFVYQLKP
jgi:low affinity Fe/Cu permease